MGFPLILKCDETRFPNRGESVLHGRIKVGMRGHENDGVPIRPFSRIGTEHVLELRAQSKIVNRTFRGDRKIGFPGQIVFQQQESHV